MDLYGLLNQIFIENNLEKYRFHSELAEAGKVLDEPDRKKYELIVNVISLFEDYGQKQNIFRPAMQWSNGARSFSVEDISDEEYALLKQLEFEKMPVAVRARVADLLWDTQREPVMGRIAIPTYKEIFLTIFDVEHWTACADIIKRAVTIAAQLGKNSSDYTDLCETVIEKLNLMDGKDPLFLSIVLLELLYAQKYKDYTVYMPLMDKIIQYAEAQGNIHKVEEAYRLKFKLLSWGKKPEAAARSNIEFAKYYERSAMQALQTDVQGLYNAAHCLECAIHLFRNNGQSAEAERIHRKLLEIQQQIPQTLTSVSQEFDSSDLYNNVMSSFDHLSFKEQIMRLVQYTTFYKKEDVRKKVLEEQKRFVFKSLFGSEIINEKGQVIMRIPPLDMAHPEEDIGLLELHMYRNLMETEVLQGETILRWGIERLNKDYDFKEDDLRFLVENNPVIPDGREEIFCRALYMGLSGKVYEALHLLAPQVENLFREIARSVGSLTVTFEDNNTSRAKTLASIFDLPELNDCYDPDILFLFKGLLNEQAGANIRNNIAHGIMEPETGSSGIGIYFVCAVLKLCAYTSRECLLILRDSDRLKNILGDSPTSTAYGTP